MKKILSNFVLSVFVIGQILSLAVYAESPIKVKLDDSTSAMIETPVETEVESKLEEKVSEVKDELVEVNEISANKVLQIKEKIKDLKELDVEEFKPIEKPIVSDDQVAVQKFKCREDSLPEKHEGVRKSQIDYVSNAQKNVWRYVEWENFDESNGHCEWTCNKDEGYVYNMNENSCVKLEAVVDDQIVAKIKCTEDSLPKNSEGVIKSQFGYVTSNYALKDVWRYVEWENFDESNGHCEWTCNKDKGYVLNERKDACVKDDSIIAVEKRKCINEPENSKGVIKSSVGYFGYPNAQGIKEMSWEYIPYVQFELVKHVCRWTCDEKNGFTLNEKKDGCIEKSDKLEVKMDFNRPNCSADSQINCLGFVKDVKYGEAFQLPESESLSFTLTYVDHNGIVSETRSAKIIGYYKNDEYLQKCEGVEKCGPARIYQPGEEVKITENVTFHAIWNVDDLNVTVKNTDNYKYGSYKYNFVNWNDSDANTVYKANETFTLLKDTILVANYDKVYVGGNGGSNGGGNNSSLSDITLGGEVSDCTVENSNYPDERNEAFLYACENGITSIKDVNDARLDEKMTRAEMAKFVTQFALLSLKRSPANLNKDCSNFNNSISSYSQEMKNYMTLSCKFEYMGIYSSNYAVLPDFMPDNNVSRAELGTVLSRILWGNKYEGNDIDYYTNHLKALKKNGIISDTTPDLLENRGYVILMLYRAAKNQGLID